jgi:enediyne biosynthesis protein E4
MTSVESSQKTNRHMKTTMNLFAAGMFLAACATALGQTTFTKITTGPVVTDVGSSGHGDWADYDGDGYLDLFASNGTSGGDLEKNFLYRNKGDGSFAKVTTGLIVSEDVDSVGGSWGDYDNDGFTDLFVPNRASRNDLLYRNNGDGSFSKITTGPVVNDGQVANEGGWWADFDNDGYLDLYVSVSVFNDSPPVNRLYRNNGDGTFSRITDNPAVSDSGDGTGAAWGDYDNDGQIDLFVGRWGQNNALYRNTGHGSFTRISAGDIVSEGGNLVDCAWADYDNDGFFDLFVVNEAGLENQVNFLYHNNGNGTFTKNTSDITADDSGSWKASAWGDYDNDGFIDLFVTSLVTKNALYHNNGDGTFTKITPDSPVEGLIGSWGCAWGDYDNDGFLDLFVPNGSAAQKNFLYRNDGNTNAWLKVKLVGTQSNRSGIGAKVRVTANIRGSSIRQLRQISGGAAGQSTLLAHFGLGDATNVDIVRVEWPSGIVQELQNVAPKQFLTITEPPRLQATGRGEFQFKSWIGMRFTVEASATLTSWTPLSTVTNTTGTVRFADPDAANYQQRFYRVRPLVP